MLMRRIVVVVTEGFSTTLFGWMVVVMATKVLHIRVTNHVKWAVVYKIQQQDVISKSYDDCNSRFKSNRLFLVACTQSPFALAGLSSEWTS